MQDFIWIIFIILLILFLWRPVVDIILYIVSIPVLIVIWIVALFTQKK